ncbi:serine/threonine-protein kinase [Cellulomonas sp. P22]|uniref:serine/threonine-protein kinase n=1 Tax=Cellulomonas sp. P22 TaxID=3373189 RepID=UPI0037B9F089
MRTSPTFPAPAERVPPAVVAALLTAGYRVVGPVGRGGGGPAWSATSLDDPARRVVVRVVDLAGDPRRQARLARLLDVRHEHLARVVDAVPVDGRTCAMLVEHVPGPTLDVVREARGPLTSGEAVTLAVPLADALDALHTAGLVHGDVSPANVVVRPDGRPVLVDLHGSVHDSPGTPGFAAPEVERGDEPGPAADVYALARVVLAQLPPAQPPGMPSPELSHLRAVLSEVTDVAADERPGARALGDACFDVDQAAPIVLPDVSVLARTELARLAGRPRTASTTRPAAGAVRGRRASRHRLRRRWQGPVLRGVVAVGAVGVCAALVVVLATRPGPTATAAAGEQGDPGTTATPATASATPATAPAAPPDGATRAPTAEPTAPDPVAAAVALTTARIDAVVAGDVTALAEVEVVGSAAYEADVRLLAGLAEAGLRIAGLRVDVQDADRVVTGGTAFAVATSTGTRQRPVPVEARVAVTSALSEHSRVGADGIVQEVVPDGPPTTVVLVLRGTSAGWRVVDVVSPDP